MKAPAPSASVKSVLAELKALGSAKNRAGMARFGINMEKAFGVSMAAQRPLERKYRHNHVLAAELWASGYHEARILAALTDDDRIEFIALFETLDDRAMVIATFMALLELMRRGSVRAWQDDRDGPIYLGRGDRFGAPLEMPAAPSRRPRRST